MLIFQGRVFPKCKAMLRFRISINLLAFDHFGQSLTTSDILSVFEPTKPVLMHFSKIVLVQHSFAENSFIKNSFVMRLGRKS
jgi:hypothetical protein